MKIKDLTIILSLLLTCIAGEALGCPETCPPPPSHPHCYECIGGSWVNVGCDPCPPCNTCNLSTNCYCIPDCDTPCQVCHDSCETRAITSITPSSPTCTTCAGDTDALDDFVLCFTPTIYPSGSRLMIDWTATGSDDPGPDNYWSNQQFCTIWRAPDTYTVKGEVCGSHKEVQIKAVVVEKLEPEDAENHEFDGDDDPNTRWFIYGVDDSDPITVTATPNPSVSEEDLPEWWRLGGQRKLTYDVDRSTQWIGEIVSIWGVSDENEEDPGHFLPLGELVRITFGGPDYLVPPFTDSVTLKALSGGSKIQLFDAWGGPVTLPETYSTSALPAYLWVWGIDASSSIKDITLALELDIAGETTDDKVNITVIDLDIDKPKGSLYASENPSSSWISSPCYHFDFQGLVSGATGAYVLQIEGDIDPAPPLAYKWTLDTAAGTISGDTTSTPTHTAPSTQGVGILTLKAMFITDETGIYDQRTVKIYKDHLARDYANFGTGGDCTDSWKITTFNVDPQPVMSDWNCHGSVKHHLNGSGTGWSTALPPLGTLKKTVVVTHKSGGGGTHPSLGTLNRGDIVVYYQDNGPHMHSQICTGNGTETYGANNKPLTYPGLPGICESWTWDTSPAGDWANDLWLPSHPGIMPVTIKVYDKP